MFWMASLIGLCSRDTTERYWVSRQASAGHDLPPDHSGQWHDNVRAVFCASSRAGERY